MIDVVMTEVSEFDLTTKEGRDKAYENVKKRLIHVESNATTKLLELVREALDNLDNLDDNGQALNEVGSQLMDIARGVSEMGKTLERVAESESGRSLVNNRRIYEIGAARGKLSVAAAAMKVAAQEVAKVIGGIQADRKREAAEAEKEAETIPPPAPEAQPS